MSSHAYGRGQRLLEYAAITLFTLLAAWGLARLAVAPAAVLPAVALAWLATDLLSGLLHWACDSFGSAGTPLVGRAFIQPFRAHHADPEEMTRHGFVETHGASCLAALPLLACALLVPWPFAQALLVFTALGALATNQCHKWAHMDEARTPRCIRWLQRGGLILPREHHRLHHTAPFDTHFCMSCGWLNAPFNAVLRAWR